MPGSNRCTQMKHTGYRLAPDFRDASISASREKSAARFHPQRRLRSSIPRRVRALVLHLVHLGLVELVGPRQAGILPSVDGALPGLRPVCGEIAFISVDDRIDVLEPSLGQKIGSGSASVARTADQDDRIGGREM